MIRNIFELQRYLDSSETTRHRARYSSFDYFRSSAGVPFHDGDIIVEEVLEGRQATIEVFVSSGRVVVVGVVDSAMYSGTNCFERFDYPSMLPQAVQLRMKDIVERYVEFVGFDQGIMNVEFAYDQGRDDLKIIEVNPRMSPQFAELFGGVNGLNTYQILECLARGIEPPVQMVCDGAAGSFVLRSFRDGTVQRAPTESAVQCLEKEHEALIMSFYSSMELLSKDDHQCDGASYRYCVVNLTAPSRLEVSRRFVNLRDLLGFDIHCTEPLTSLS